MRHHERLWVVIADGEHARVLVPTDTRSHYRTIRTMQATTAHLRAADLGSDAPGRSCESAAVIRHAVEPRTDPHTKAKARFAGEVAEVLNEAAAAAVFDRLVVAAPAHTLHDLRAALSAEAAGKLVAEIQKDLLKVPDANIAAHLPSDLRIYGPRPDEA